MQPLLDQEALVVRPWPDDVIDRVGHDPRSAYVERFWLGILGPSATWLLRRLAAGFETCPEGFELDLATTAHALGLKPGPSRNAPFGRSVERLVRFKLARVPDPATLEVRRRIPPLTHRQVRRMPPELADEHARWVDKALSAAVLERRTRARRLALSLAELGEGAESVERHLLRWRYHPQLALEATRWALSRLEPSPPPSPSPTPSPTPSPSPSPTPTGPGDAA